MPDTSTVAGNGQTTNDDLRKDSLKRCIALNKVVLSKVLGPDTFKNINMEYDGSEGYGRIASVELVFRDGAKSGNLLHLTSERAVAGRKMLDEIFIRYARAHVSADTPETHVNITIFDALKRLAEDVLDLEAPGYAEEAGGFGTVSLDPFHEMITVDFNMRIIEIVSSMKML